MQLLGENVDQIVHLLSFSDDNGHNAFHLAAKEGHIDILTRLVKAGGLSLAQKRTNTGLTALQLAPEGQVKEKLRKIITKMEQEALYHKLLKDEELEILVSTVERIETEQKVKAQCNKTNELRSSEGRFAGEPKDLICGHFKQASAGLHKLLRISEVELRRKEYLKIQGIQEEVDALGDPEVSEQLKYIREEAASEQKFDNGVRDEGRAGMRLQDFVSHENARLADLSEEEVVALRLYTTPAFKQINGPLRDLNRTEPHPLSVTARWIQSGLKKLRPNDIQSAVLWRGLKNIKPSDKFAKEGGTEVRTHTFS
jgi:hypothetical protein